MFLLVSKSCGLSPGRSFIWGSTVYCVLYTYMQLHWYSKPVQTVEIQVDYFDVCIHFCLFFHCFLFAVFSPWASSIHEGVWLRIVQNRCLLFGQNLSRGQLCVFLFLCQCHIWKSWFEKSLLSWSGFFSPSFFCLFWCCFFGVGVGWHRLFGTSNILGKSKVRGDFWHDFH